MPLPLEEENGDDDADNEDHSQHGPYHPQEPFLLVYDRLRIHVRGGHGIRIRAGGVHGLQEARQIYDLYFLHMDGWVGR